MGDVGEIIQFDLGEFFLELQLVFLFHALGVGIKQQADDTHDEKSVE